MRRMARGVALTIEVVGAVIVALMIGLAIFLSHVNANVDAYRKELIAVVAQSTGLSVAIDGALHFALTPLPTLIADHVRVADPPWSGRPEMMRIDRVEVVLSPADLLAGRSRLSRLSLSGADIHLLLDRHGRANWWVVPEAGAAAPPGEPVDIGRLEIVDSRIDFRDDGSGRTAVLGVERAVAGLPLEGPFTIKAAADWFGTPFTLSVTGGRFVDLVGDRPLWPVSWHLEGAEASMDAQGTIDHPISQQTIDLDVSVAGQRLAALRPALGVALPDAGPFGGAARLSGGWSHYRLGALSGHLGVSDFAGQLSLVIAGTRPRIEGHLQSGVLNRVDVTGAAPDTWVPPNDGRVLDARPLPFEALLGLDARIGLKIGRLVTWPIDLFDLEASIDLDDGRLAARPLRFTVAGGRVDVVIDADAGRQPPTLHIAGRADGMASERLLPALGMTLSPSGPLWIDLDLSGWGPSLRAFLGGANGRLRLGIGEGTLPVRQFDLIASDLVQAIMPWATRHGDRTELNCLATRFVVRDGVATAERLLIDTTRITVTGGGEINLGTEQLDLKLDPRPKDPSLISLATRMRVSGSLTNYSAAPDAVGLAKGAAAGLALAIGELNPLALVLPFISIGTGVAKPCLNDPADRPEPRRPALLAPLDAARGLLDSLGHAITHGAGR